MLREYKDFFNREASPTFLNLELILDKMTLTQRINEIGEDILEANATLETAIEQNDKKAILDLTGRFSDHCADYFELLKSVFPAGRDQTIAERAPQDDSSLAMSILDHDITKLMGFVGMNVGINKRDDELDHELLTYYDTAFPIVLMIPYLATGDKKFLRDIPYDNIVDRLTTQLGEANIKFYPHSNCTKTIPSDIYFAAVQLVKNAKKAFYLAKKENRLPEDASDVITLGINLFPNMVDPLKERYCVYVIDNGPGIAQEDLPKIFGSYSTTGSGIGLQVVKKIAGMRNGHIAVLSTLPGQPGYKYNINARETEEKGTIARFDDPSWHGTNSVLHLNRHI